jgi:hypothetical protein
MADETMHAVLVIDMDDATAEEIRCVIRAVRSSAVDSDCPGWPDQLAVLVRAGADALSEHVSHIVSDSRLQSA